MLDLTIETNANHDLITNYLDSLQSKASGRFAMPARYDFLRNGGDFEYFPEKNKVAYFANNPKEVYHICSNGGLFLAEVHNPLLAPDWIMEKQQLTADEYARIERRLDTLLQAVVTDARLEGPPDSLIFSKKPFDKVVCTLNKP